MIKITHPVVNTIRALSGQNYSLRMIAEAIGVSHEAVRLAMIKWGIPHKENRVCQTCGKPLTRQQLRFCSRACRYLARYTPMSVPRPCKRCQIDFTPTHIHQKYCSQACRYLVHHTPMSIPRPCKKCQTPFTPTYPHQKYCSSCRKPKRPLAETE